MPYECKFCGEQFCAEHRLPERHTCPGLLEHRRKLKEEGRIFEIKEPNTSRTKDSSVRSYISAFKGNISFLILGIMILVYLMQEIVEAYNLDLHNHIFVLGPDFIDRPWSIITNIFAHGHTPHLLINSIVLFFFGPVLERYVGSSKTLELFLIAGITGGLAQVFLVDSLVLGASGGILGIFGALTILVPKMTIFLIFIPMQLWMATVFYIVYNLAFIGTGPEASVAHLAGLAVGFIYGYFFRKSSKYRRKGPKKGFRRF